jgi:molybdopterin molybdotransferase
VADAPLPFDEAFARVQAEVRALPGEDVPVEEAAGRFLSGDVRAVDAVPPFDNSVVDGFAVHADDVAGASADHPVDLKVVGGVVAGEPGRTAFGPGEAMRIMTGAPIPPGADGIVMLEWTEWTADHVRVFRPAPAGQRVRRAGEDTRPGDIVLEAGHRLGAAELGVLASIGAASVSVHRRPRVAVLATGDELVGPGPALLPGQIRSSNHLTLAAQARDAGGDVLALGIARDEDDDLRGKLRAASSADVLLTSGGVSVGDRDRVQAVLEQLGFRKIFWRVASSPGKPLLFGRLGGTLVFGLPGNPVSSMVAFENFVRPALLGLQGSLRPLRTPVSARTETVLSGPEDRRHFARVRVFRRGDALAVREVGPHGSGNLRSMANANGLAIVPEGVARREVGEWVEVRLLGEPDPEPREEW